MTEARRLLDFDDTAELAVWQPIDDVVMGGVSRSTFKQASPGIASFSGLVSLDHGGGFASVRTQPRDWPVAGAEAFVLRCRGDGKWYKFTLRVDDAFDGVQYQARFVPPGGAWTTVVLPVVEFVASRRGQAVPGGRPLDPAQIRQFGLMISDRQAGPFELLLDWIGVAR